jgi:hypothetical protein
MTTKFFTSEAAQSGHSAGLAVLAGKLSVESAGDKWLKWADRSHAKGVAFEKAYAATGAQR